jgi:hypothetical protein
MKQMTDYGRVTLAGLVGFGLGALAMFVYDPVSGRRRRALARDKVTAAASDLADAASGKAHDLQNRAKGLAHEAVGTMSNVLPWSGPERRVPPRRTPAERIQG